MLGTIVNTCSILCGTAIGCSLRRGIREEYQEGLYNAMGFAAFALGVNTVVRYMPQSAYPVLFILSLALGSLLGTMWDWDGKFQRMMVRMGKSDLSKGLSTAILLFCIGTLSILGPIQSAVQGDNTFLFTNATLDFVTAGVLASAYGWGIGIAALVLFCWQGSLWLLGKWLGSFIAPGLMAEVSIVGGVLIMVSGISILKLKECKTLNMLPALFVSVLLYYAAEFLFGK